MAKKNKDDKDKKNKEQEKKGKRGKEADSEKSSAGAERVNGATEAQTPEAWIGQEVRVRHPINLKGGYAVGSSNGRLKEVGDRGVLLIKGRRKDQQEFFPWSSVFLVSLNEK